MRVANGYLLTGFLEPSLHLNILEDCFRVLVELERIVSIDAQVYSVNLVFQAPVEEPFPLIPSPKLRSEANPAVTSIPGHRRSQESMLDRWEIGDLNSGKSDFAILYPDQLEESLYAVDRAD